MKGYLSVDLLLSLFLMITIIFYLLLLHIVSLSSVKNLTDENKNQTTKFYEKLNKFYSKFSSKLNEYSTAAYVTKNIDIKWYEFCINYFEIVLRLPKTYLTPGENIITLWVADGDESSLPSVYGL